MALVIVDNYNLGGVDARSSGVNYPIERSLKCRNFIPNQGGWLQLRNGYTQLATVRSSWQFLAMRDFITWGGGHYIVGIAAGELWRYDIAGNNAAAVNILPANIVLAINSSTYYGYAFANNSLFIAGQNTYQYDGTNARAMGLPVISDVQAAAVSVQQGMPELTSTQASAVALASNGGGGSFPVASAGGYLFYVALFDDLVNEIGPATINVASGRVITIANDIVNITGLPNVSPTNWRKLIGCTGDGDSLPYLLTLTSASVTSITAAGLTATATCPTHGLSANQIVSVQGNATTAFNGVFKVASVADVNTFTYALPYAVTATNTGGTAKRVLDVNNSTTTAAVSAFTRDTAYLLNQDRGLPATSVGGAQPGYQWYLAMRHATTNHVGNRTKIGLRIANATRCNIRIAGLPSTGDAERLFHFGRTGDGAEVPYICTDAAANRISTANSTDTAITITNQAVDYNYELPTRNSQPPLLDMLCRVNDRLYGASSLLPYIYRSESELDQRNGSFLGRPQESWAANNFETFPTAQNLTCIAEYENEVMCFTRQDMGILVDLVGATQWLGPFNIGCAGPYAFAKTPYGPFWLTGEKQLATLGAQGPIVVSEEYEASLLAQIGDAYLNKAELVYYRDASRHIDRLVINARDSSGNNFMVCHDFRLRDQRNPQGQGYDLVYTGAMLGNTAFNGGVNIVAARDNNDKLQLYGSDPSGKIHKLETGGDDNGAAFTGEYVALINFGPQRLSVPYFEWFGDQNLNIQIAQDLNAAYADLVASSSLPVIPYPSGENDFHWRANVQTSTEMRYCYLRLTLASHAADGNLNLSNPVHLPLENYGRVYMLRAGIGQQRGPA